MENMNTWGILILLFLLFIVFGGNGVFGNNRNEYGCSAVTNCEVEKQTIINTATTQNLINTQNEKTRDFLGNKIDFYEYSNLRDQLAQERTKNVVLENRVYTDARFNDITAQNVAISREIERLGCETVKRPPYFAQGYVPTGCPVPCSEA